MHTAASPLGVLLSAILLRRLPPWQVEEAQREIQDNLSSKSFEYLRNRWKKKSLNAPPSGAPPLSALEKADLQANSQRKSVGAFHRPKEGAQESGEKGFDIFCRAIELIQYVWFIGSELCELMVTLDQRCRWSEYVCALTEHQLQNTMSQESICCKTQTEEGTPSKEHI